MKCIMRLDKSQVPSLIKFTSGSGDFNRDLHIMAGYRRYDVLCIGGAGGPSGNAVVSNGLAGTAYGSGGGGGGTILAWGRLSDLAQLTPYSVGAVGTNGSNSTGHGNRAGAGGAGGDSVFGPYSGLKGGAAAGSFYDGQMSIARWDFGVAGGGGSNSAGLGTAGLGGGDRGGGSAPGTENPQAPTAGTWAFGSPDPVTGGVIGGGGGGGGGCGGVAEGHGTPDHVPTQSGAGAGPSEYPTPGGPPVSNKGGGGGGGNFAIFTAGTSEYYGSNQPGHNPGGLVALKFS